MPRSGRGVGRGSVRLVPQALAVAEPPARLQSVTAKPAATTRTVTVSREGRGWADGYFDRLIGVRVAFMLNERGVYGTLTAVVETEDEFTLTFEDPRVED